jgi:hypothetical protein
VTLVATRLGDDEPQVRIDHAFLGREVTALDSLRQLDLFARGQKRVDPSPAEEQSQRIRGRRGAGVGIEFGSMNRTTPRPPRERRISTGAPALASLFNLIGVVLAANSRR